MTEFYKKVVAKNGRVTYQLVSQYDSELHKAMPIGSHLVIITNKAESRRYKIDPTYAPMIAAGIIAEERISKHLMEQLSFKPEQTPITPEEAAAWDHMKEVFGENRSRLMYPSIAEATRAAVAEMQQVAIGLMENETLKSIYEQYVNTAILVDSEVR